MESPYVIPSAVAIDDSIPVNFSSIFADLPDNSSGLMIPEEMDLCDENNPLFNCSLEEYLEYNLGPKTLALTTAVPVTVVYVLVFITAVVGNVCVCLIIVRNQSMHTATNYYLFSLAISDLTLVLLGVPNDISLYWHQYPYSMGIGFCKLRALLSETATYSSVLTIVAFSMERYLAICHPLHLYTMSGLQRAVRIIAALWIISLICAIPFAMYTTIHYLDYPPNSHNKTLDSAFCAMLTQPQGCPLWELSSVIFFLLPAGIILILYARMGSKIRARSKHQLGKGLKGSVHGETRQAQSRRAIIRMLAAVVIAFFVCWAPFHAQRLMYIYGHHWVHFKDLNEWMFSVTGWLYYVSSTVNPILYNVMSNRYRVAFRETLCCGRQQYSGTGFARDQSSFRETTIATTDGTHLVRVKSETLQRVNTTSTRLSRYSTNSSKDFSNLNHVKSQKWSNGKGWNGDNKIKPNHSSMRTKLYNQEGESSGQKHNCYKRKEIMFEKETNSLLNSSEPRVDPLLDSPEIPKMGQSDSMQEIVVVSARGPSNGIKKFYPFNMSKDLSYPSSVIRQQDEGFVDEKSNEDNVSETCI